MEHIRQALDRAKGTAVAEKTPAHIPQEAVRPFQQQSQPPAAALNPAPPPAPRWAQDFTLSMGHLNDNRIVAHDGTDPRSRAFDILRTQVRQAMDKEGWQVLGVTSPTPMCGKSVVAANLALSMARQPDRAVLLVDMDLQRPQISNYLGLRPSHGIIDVVEGRKTLSSAISRASFRSKHLLVLPCQKPTSQSSEMMASPSMAEMFQEIRRAYKDCTVIVDLPPILTGDHVIATLPHLDCAIFVAAVGNSTLAEVKECSKHFETTPILQVVVNKSTESTTSYYYQSAYAKMMPR